MARSQSGSHARASAGSKSNGKAGKANAQKATGAQASQARSSSKAASPAEKQARRARASAPQVQQQDKAPIVSDEGKRTIAGIVFVVAAIALLLIILVPSNGVASTFVSTSLKLTLGIGAYILPFMLIIIGVTFVAKFEQERMPARFAIGLTLIFISILVLFSLFTPLSLGDKAVPSMLFSETQLVSRGGYVGAGLAWVGLSLLGLAVSVVFWAGVIAIGLVVIGFSITKLMRAIAEKAQRHAEREEEQLGVLGVESYQEDVDRANRSARPRAGQPRGPRGSQGRQLADDASSMATQRLGARNDAAPRFARASESQQQTQALTRKLGRSQDDEKQAAQTQPTVKLAPAAKPQKPAKESDGEENGFALPSFDLLHISKPTKRTKAADNELADTASRLQRTLEDFGILATVVDWVAGPTVTLFEVDLPPGVRVSRITALNDDIALALAAPGVRIFAPVPGTHYVGIEVPNITRENVLLGDVLQYATGGPLEMAIGKDVEGKPVICDLAKMPHLLIGGTTGSGKSVGINSMIMSMLMRATPDEVRFIMIDPKRVEFTPYNGIPHLYVPVVTESKEAASALSWGVAEMERRLKVFSKAGARNIGEYNEMVETSSLDDESATKLPYIVIVIDELADLMMNVGKEVEFSISRIAQLARAAGIHLIVATQRPSANVVTGLIKANITNRMAFNVASGLDSRVILDVSGAESLIGKGDLLLSKPEYAKPRRIQGCWVSPEEIGAVVEAVKTQGEPEYHSEILKTNLITLGESAPDGSGGSVTADDPLIWEAADIVVASGFGSTSNIQRKLKVGYSRAGRIMDMLEEKGVVGPPNGSKPRDVLVDAMELEALKAFEANDERE